MMKTMFYNVRRESCQTRSRCCHLLVGVIVIVVGLLSGCKADVDLNQIDSKIKTQVGLAFPVGNIHFTLNDFLGGNQISNLYTDNNGVFHYADSITFSKEFHPLDIGKFTQPQTDQFRIYDRLKAKGIIEEGDTEIKGHPGRKDTLDFKMKFQFNGVNKNPADERIDSVRVSAARFISSINTKDFDLKWEYIDQVVMTLNEQFRRNGGNDLVLYDKTRDKLKGYGYGKTIPMDLGEFTMHLIKDITKEVGPENIIDTCAYTLTYIFSIPEGQSVTISKSSAFTYTLKTEFSKFDAAWGWFKPAQMSDHGAYDINWGPEISLLKLKLKQPEIEIRVTHSVSAPARVRFNRIAMEDANGTQAPATWNGKESADFYLTPVLDPTGPIKSETGQDLTVTNCLLFNNTDSLGHIDTLLSIQPKKFIFDYEIGIDEDPDPKFYPFAQHRITSNTKINGLARFDIPFILDAGSQVDFVSYINDIHFEQVNLDSILQTVPVVEEAKARDIKLFVNLSNRLPFEIMAKVTFLDKDSNVINLQLLEGLEDNTILLPAPDIVNNRVADAEETALIIGIAQEKFDLLRQCRRMKIEAYIGKNKQACAIDKDNSLDVQLGVAASVDAILNFNKNK